MKQIIVPEVEDIKQGILFDFHKEIFKIVENPIVLVLLWTTNDKKEEKV